MTRKPIDRLNNFLFSVFHNETGLMAKRIELAPDGTLSKIAAAQMWQGRVETRTAALAELPAILAALAYNQAIGLGVCDRAPADIVRKDDLPSNPGAIARTQHFFKMPGGFALGFIESDIDLPPEALTTAIVKAFPAFEDAAKVILSSSSAGIYPTGEDRPLSKSCGVHLYLTVKDGTDFIRFGDALCKRLWLAGFGHIAISEDGKLLVRQIVDKSTFAPERIIFEAAPILGPGLERRAPAPILIDGGTLDTSLCLSLTPEENARYAKLVAAAKQAKKPEADAAWEAYKLRRGQEISRKKHVPIEEAIDILVRAKEGRPLDGGFPLVFEKYGEVSAAEVLKDLAKFDKHTLLDPMEPNYPSRYCAMFFAGDGRNPYIHSFAHGGQTYHVASSAAAAKTETHIVSGVDFVAVKIPVPPEVIGGLLRAGQVGMLAGGSKTCKSWTLMGAGLAVTAGLLWLGLKTTQGRVLYLNGELPAYDSQQRLCTLFEALGLPGIPPGLDIWHLRGLRKTIPQVIEAVLRRQGEVGEPYALIIPDPLYRFNIGRDENDNTAQADTMEEIGALAEQSGAAVLTAHHFSKGNKSQTDHLDRASGAGMFARAPDTFMTMTAHTEPGCYTVEATCRGFAQPDKFVVRWEYPLWRIDDSLDPEQLKKPLGKMGATPRYSPEGLVDLLPIDGLHNGEWLKLARERLGIRKTRFNELVKMAKAMGLVGTNLYGAYVRKGG